MSMYEQYVRHTLYITNGLLDGSLKGEPLL